MASNKTKPTNDTSQIGSPKDNSKAFLLKKYISDVFAKNVSENRDLRKEFTTANNISYSRLDQWLNKNAIVIDDSLFLMANLSTETKLEEKKRIKAFKSDDGADWVLLPNTIAHDFMGNQSLFARNKGHAPQQVSRWLKVNRFIFSEGQVYRFQRKLKKG